MRIRPPVALLAAALIAMGTAIAGCAAAPARDAPASPIEVAAGIYALRGSGGEVDSANRGRIGNAGFIVGNDGVIVVDTGTSYRQGVELLDAVRGVSDRPVRLAIVTQARQEFLFGAAAFRERGVPIHMQRDAARLMAARCEGCLKTLKQTLGETEMQGTQVVRPDVEFDGEHRLHLIGRPVHVLHYGRSSGLGDVAVLDERTGTLFAGGLLDNRRIPDVQDSDIPGWQRALAALRRLPIAAIVPGHGPVADASLIDTVERYLTQLQARLVELLNQGAPLSDVPDAASLPPFEGWDQYGVIHRRNASIVFLRLERELLLK